MTIHHATIKRAEGKNIILSEEIDSTTGDTFVVAHWPEQNQRIEHIDPKVALDAMILLKTFRTDYPAMALDIVDRREIQVSVGDDENSEMLYTGTKVPDLLDVLEDAVAAEFDPELGFDEDDERHYVVPQKYKDMYAERGNRNHCSDWIATELDGAFLRASTTPTGKPTTEFDVDAFTAFLVSNGVDMSGKWADLPNSGQRGWVGRYRMNGRQKLELVLTRKGYMVLPGRGRVEVPIDVLHELCHKHPKITPEWEG